MKKILHLISSFRGDDSYTIKLGNAIVYKLKAENPGAIVQDVNLAVENYPHLDAPHFQAFMTPYSRPYRRRQRSHQLFR